MTRAFHPGQPSILFSILAWLAVAIGGLHESTLRVPSLIAASVAAIGVYLLARRFSDVWQSLLATALFTTYGTVAFAAVDARPYALGLMAVIWSMLMLMKWCETGRLSSALACVFLVALSLYLHYLCATMLPLYVYYLVEQNRMSRPSLRYLWPMTALLVVLLLALLPHAAQLWRLRVEHSFSGMPAIRDVIEALVYYRLVAGILAGVAIARFLYRGFEVRLQALFTRFHFFLAAWYVVPILFLLTLSLCSEAKLFVPRYYLWGVPGLVILVASAMSAVHPLPARRVLGLTILLAFCLRRLPIGDAGHAGEDWRGALRTARAAAEQFDATILLRSGFPEMPMVRDGHDSIVEDPLMAPLAMYPVPVKSVRMLPCWLTGTDRRRLEEIVSGLIGRRSTFVFISPSEGPPTATWLLGRLSGEDYRISTLGPFTGMTTIVFQPRGVHAKK